VDIRRQAEKIEKELLSPYACCSCDSRGRERYEEDCQVRTAFQRDRDRIIHSKSFRRLKAKTQVFLIPEGDHYRTRLTHTLEVAQIARTAARALRLNEDLTEAIALGHDLGHTPFGHGGEEALNEVFLPGFRHNEQSLRVVDILEGKNGLNLTWEVRDGILNHTGPNLPITLEGQIVRFSDRIAYINHDIDDALRGGIITFEQLPKEPLEILGQEHRKRINTMVIDIIENSWGKSKIAMSTGVQKAIDELRSFLFEYVYIGSEAKKEEGKARHIVQGLFKYFISNPDALSQEYYEWAGKVGMERAVCDYIAGMTDHYAVAQYTRIFVPQSTPL